MPGTALGTARWGELAVEMHEPPTHSTQFELALSLAGERDGSLVGELEQLREAMERAAQDNSQRDREELDRRVEEQREEMESLLRRQRAPVGGEACTTGDAASRIACRPPRTAVNSVYFRHSTKRFWLSLQ